MAEKMLVLENQIFQNTLFAGILYRPTKIVSKGMTMKSNMIHFGVINAFLHVHLNVEM